MSRYNQMCKLIARTLTRDSYGVSHNIDVARWVYCNTYTISDDARYNASVQGLRLAARVQIRKADYDGEKLVELDGELLTVEHVNATSPDYVVLSLVEKLGD